MLPEFDKHLAEAARVIKTRKGIMKKDVYNLFRRVIHPDTGKHVSEEDRNRAAQSLEELKTLLLKEDDAPTHPYTKLEDMPGFKARRKSCAPKTNGPRQRMRGSKPSGRRRHGREHTAPRRDECRSQ
jgi:hypothetical protein